MQSSEIVSGNRRRQSNPMTTIVVHRRGVRRERLPLMLHVAKWGLSTLVLGSIAPSIAIAGPAFVRSPSGNIQCSIAAPSPRQSVLCQTIRPPRIVSLQRSGRPTVCVGLVCLATFPVKPRPLPYNKHIRSGLYTCSSLATGMRCTNAISRYGFLIRKAGVTIFRIPIT